MRTTILIDDPNSWFMPYGADLANRLKARGDEAIVVNKASEVEMGDCLFLLSCGRIVGPEILRRNKHNIVVHASKLPEGRGFAPLAWQILEGRNEVWLTMFEAIEEADAGDIYLQEPVCFNGHELHDELRDIVGRKVVALAYRFVDEYPVPSRPQQGAGTWYRRRTPADSELDSSKPLSELFNQLRVASNEQYPAFFRMRFTDRERIYVLRVEEKI